MEDQPARGTGFRVFARATRTAPIESLRGLATGNIADAMYGHGSMSSAIRPLWRGQPAFVGRALTVTVSPGNGMMIRRAIASSEPGDVLVVNAQGAMDRAVLGGNVATDIVSHGIVGVVVDGVVRDLDELEELGLPTFARGVTPRSGSDPSGRGEVLGPIACGRVAVMPGDVVIGDNDGVVVVPLDDAAQVAARAHSIQQRKGSADDLQERLVSAKAGRVTAYDNEQLHRDLLASGLVELGHPWSA